jgi:phosphate transport system permease protein
VSTATQTRQSPEDDLALVPAKPRIGDKVFTGLSTGAGIAIFVILAAVALFLIAQAFPALTSTPEMLESRGYGPFWSWVAPFAFGTVYSAFWALVFAVPVAIGIACSSRTTRRAAWRAGWATSSTCSPPCRPSSTACGASNTFASALQPLHVWLATYLGWFPLFTPPASGTGRTMLTASLVLAVMILPIITSLCREVFLQTPKLHEEAALALGATRWEMIRMAVLPVRPRRHRVGGHARPGPRPRRDHGGGHGAVPRGRRHQVRHAHQQNPNTIAANIALNFPEASGLRINQLIASGLVLFVITLAVNMLARWIVARRAAFSGAN